MAHVQKYGKGALGHMLAHYDRRKGGENSKIDPNCTHLNYNLAQSIQPLEQLEYIHKVLEDENVHCLKRKDVNVMCDWVITAPKDLPKDKQEEFFQESFNYLVAMYGEKSVVSAYVHMDETTPHMHFCFIPLVEDKKKGGLKVSAKDVINRGVLKSFHGKLEKHLSSKMGIQINLLKDGITKEFGNQSIAELKKLNYILENMANELGEVTSKKSFLHKGKVTVKEEDVETLKKADGIVKLAMQVSKQASEVQNLYLNKLKSVKVLEDTISKLILENDALKDANKALNDDMTILNTLKTEKANLEQIIATKNEDIKKLEKKIAKLPTQEKYNEIQKLCDDVIRDNDKLKNDNAILQTKLDKANKELDDICIELGYDKKAPGR